MHDSEQKVKQFFLPLKIMNYNYINSQERGYAVKFYPTKLWTYSLNWTYAYRKYYYNNTFAYIKRYFAIRVINGQWGMQPQIKRTGGQFADHLCVCDIVPEKAYQIQPNYNQDNKYLTVHTTFINWAKKNTYFNQSLLLIYTIHARVDAFI